MTKRGRFAIWKIYLRERAITKGKERCFEYLSL